MARKAVLEGGKRDEIIEAATKLFFTEGFENTSVRKILGMVDGEVGMFYHYFSSKEELFDVVVDRFFRQYAKNFADMARQVNAMDDLVEVFFPSYGKAMEEYRMIEGKMHWTIRFALHERTLLSLAPVVEDMLARLGCHAKYPLDIAAGKLIADVSVVIHSKSFAKMKDEEKKEILKKIVDDATKGKVE